MSTKVWQPGQHKETPEEKAERLATIQQYLDQPYDLKVITAENRIWEWHDTCREYGKDEEQGASA